MMKVSELIAALSQFDGDLLVITEGCDCYGKAGLVTAFDGNVLIERPPQCRQCHVDLELVIAMEPYSPQHWQCPECDGTYCIEEV